MTLLRNVTALSSLVLLFCLPITAAGQSPANESSHASAQMESDHDHIHGGSDLTFKLSLDGSVPEGGSVALLLGTTGTPNQQFWAQDMTLDQNRTTATFHAKLPVDAVSGEWHIASVSISSASGSLSGRVETNDLRFTVEGHMTRFPTKGTVTLQSESH